jgi:hypothetical protein
MRPNRHPKIVVVGFTEAGKTSLIRTLLQDPFFGGITEAGDAAAPGRYLPRTLQGHVVPVTLDGVTIAEICDTPGFRRVVELLASTRERLMAGASARPAERRQIVVEEVRRLRDESARSGVNVAGETGAYMHEDQALEAAFAADVVLYVVDASVPPSADDRALGLLFHEMRLPVVAVQNRAAPAGSRGDYREDWSYMLLEFGVSRIEILDAWLPADDAVPELMRAMRSVVDPDRRPAFDIWSAWHADQLEQALARSAEACRRMLKEASSLEVACSYPKAAGDEEIRREREAARVELGKRVDAAVIQGLREVWRAHGFPLEQFRANFEINATRLVGFGDGIVEAIRGTWDTVRGWVTRQRTEYHRIELAWRKTMARRLVHAMRRIRSFGHANPMIVDVSEPARLPADEALSLDEAIARRDWLLTEELLANAARGRPRTRSVPR